MLLILGVLLVISVFLEGTVFMVPLVLICLLCLAILKKDSVVYLVGFFSGIFLDILTVQTVGQRSIFFIVFIFLILLYQRKYEINSYPFVAASGFFGSLIYSFIFGYSHFFWWSLISCLIASILFMVLRGRLTPQKISI
jgi:cell shape-determining protein MreD